VICFGLGRSGSSYFCDQFSRIAEFRNFGELFHYPLRNPKKLFGDLRYVNSKTYQGAIAKLLTYQIEQQKLNPRFIAEALVENEIAVVNLVRKPFSQCLSVCYSNLTGVWHAKKNAGGLRDLAVLAIDPAIFRVQCYRNMIQRIYEREVLNSLEEFDAVFTTVNYENLLSGDLDMFDIAKRLFGSSVPLTRPRVEDEGEYSRLSAGGIYDRVSNVEELELIYRQAIGE
jgi:hypothetical protein